MYLQLFEQAMAFVDLRNLAENTVDRGSSNLVKDQQRERGGGSKRGERERGQEREVKIQRYKEKETKRSEWRKANGTSIPRKLQSSGHGALDVNGRQNARKD